MLSEENRIGDLPVVDLWMVRGSLAYIGVFEARLATAPTVEWMSDGGRRLPILVLSRCTWRRILHAMVAGVTSRATGVFRTAGVQGLVIPDDPIRLAVGHIIKYLERPHPCNLLETSAHYKVTDQLSVNDLQRPVLFASGFSGSGWEMRSLVDSELAHAFDIPPFVSWELVADAKRWCHFICFE